MTGARVSLVMDQAIKIRARSGSGLEPFIKLRAWAFNGPSNLLNKTLRFSGLFPKVGIGRLLGLGLPSRAGWVYVWIITTHYCLP